MVYSHAAIVAASLLVMTLSNTARAQQNDSTEQVRRRERLIEEVANAERSFRADVARLGTRAGFIANFARDGILFRPGPVNAIEYLTAQEARPGLLEWEPAFVDVSDDGSMGFTTGPWTFRASASDTVLGAGFYSTVWIRDENGAWKVLVDHGVGVDTVLPVPVPQEVRSPLLASAWAEPTDVSTTRRKQIRETIDRLERRLSALPAENAVEKFLEKVRPDARFQRLGSMPFEGIEAIRGYLGAHPRIPIVEATGGDLAGSQDMAYTVGSYHFDDSTETPENGVFLRIWRAEKSDDWRIVYELLAPR